MGNRVSRWRAAKARLVQSLLLATTIARRFVAVFPGRIQERCFVRWRRQRQIALRVHGADVANRHRHPIHVQT